MTAGPLIVGAVQKQRYFFQAVVKDGTCLMIGLEAKTAHYIKAGDMSSGQSTTYSSSIVDPEVGT